MNDSRLTAVFESIFAPWHARSDLSAGWLDRDFREPQRILNVLDAEGLLPPAERTITVTGSKGKGSVARLIAWNLQQQGHRVGLLLSPHESNHRDRFRVQNTPIAVHELWELSTILPTVIDEAMQDAPEHYYPSPHALFLTLALVWFKRQRVDYWVLECGRGARYDEVGNMAAGVSVVSSVFEEHAERLGADWPAIAADKLSICEHAAACVLAESVGKRLSSEALDVPENCRMVEETGNGDWLAVNEGLARTCLQILGVDDFRSWPLPSFGSLVCGAGVIDFEGRIHHQSPAYHDVADAPVILAMSRDKDWHGLATELQPAQCYWLMLDDLAEESEWQALYASDVCLGRLPGDGDSESLKSLLEPLLSVHGRLVFWGVQLALVALRNAYNVPLAGPQAQVQPEYKPK